MAGRKDTKNALLKSLVAGAHAHGPGWLWDQLEDRNLKRLVTEICKACEGMKFETEYWSCLECRLTWLVLNRLLQEKENLSGSVQRRIQNEINDLFMRVNRHTRAELRRTMTRYNLLDLEEER